MGLVTGLCSVSSIVLSSSLRPLEYGRGVDPALRSDGEIRHRGPDSRNIDNTGEAKADDYLGHHISPFMSVV